MALSALDDKSVEPTPAQLAKVLGRSGKAWSHLVSRMETLYGALSEQWSFSGAKYGWSCRLRRKKRTILYLTPQHERFQVGVVLGDRALTLLRRDELSPEALAMIDDAPRYGEGTGVRLPVTALANCADVEILVEAKMATGRI
jgi:hypothetical protein